MLREQLRAHGGLLEHVKFVMSVWERERLPTAQQLWLDTSSGCTWVEAPLARQLLETAARSLDQVRRATLAHTENFLLSRGLVSGLQAVDDYGPYASPRPRSAPRPNIPPAELKRWFQRSVAGLRNRDLNETQLWEAAKSAHPKYQVSRDSLRKLLRPGGGGKRKPGPKQKRR
jgi:hypothetical protein